MRRPPAPAFAPILCAAIASALAACATSAVASPPARLHGLSGPCRRLLPGGDAAGGGPLAAPPRGACVAAADSAVRVLVFTRTAGFRHDSIADAWDFFAGLGAGDGVLPTLTEDPAVFADATLADYDVVAFVNTTGDVLDEAQQAALERFVRGGRGWVGVHSAADTEYEWPFYGRLVGAYFISHPLIPVEVEVTTEERDHPTTSHLPERFTFTDEIYNFDRNPRFDNAILLTIDEAGFIWPNIPDTRSMGVDHPIAWYKDFEGGRSFYTNLGHRPETWRDPAFQRHLLAGIRWAAEPASYSRIVVTTEARNPIHMAIAPDGRVFYVERTGEVRVWEPATGRVREVLRLDVSTAGENGLMGVALDPDFARQPWIYLYYALDDFVDPGEGNEAPSPTEPIGTNVLARFLVGDDGTIDPSSRHVLLEVPSDRVSGHEGGGLAFDADGTLYVGIGDNTDAFGDAGGYAPIDRRPGRDHFNALRTAPNPHDLRGKILRIAKDGGIPDGNLFASAAEGRPEIYVMGVRNPYRLAVDPGRGRLFWGDVGPDGIGDGPRGPRGYDEINLADRPGDYGWPFCIGPNRAYVDYDFATGAIGAPFSCARMVPPLFAYDYFTASTTADPDSRALLTAAGEEGFTGRTAIAGTVVPQPGAHTPFALPRRHAGALLMSDWARDLVAAVSVGRGGELLGVERLFPWIQLRRPIDLEVGPDGALYVLEFGSDYFGDNDDARLSRIEYSETGTLTPVADLTVSRTAGHAPLVISASAAGSRAPGAGDRIVGYEWDVDGDGRVDGRGETVQHRFEADGVYPVSLTVVGASGRRSFPAVAEVVVGNEPPEVHIESPLDGAVVPAGAPVVLRGRATDPEDGEAPCEDLRWDIRLGHNAHSHPRAERSGCEASFVAEIPGDHAELGNTFFAVELTYEDRGGSGGTPALTGRAGVRFFVE